MATTINGSTGASQVQDDIVSLAKMASGTDGNIISYDASGNPVAVATGSDGQVLTSTGAGSPPAFEALPAGGVTHLGTLTTTSGTSRSITINLSLYNQIWINTDNVGAASGTSKLQFSLNGNALADMTGDNAAANGMWAAFKFDLRTNAYVTQWMSRTSATSGSSVTIDLPTLHAYYNLSTNYRALTSAALVLGHSGQTFDSGSAEIYGVS